MRQTVPEPPDRLAAAGEPTSVALVRAAQATENAWRRMERQFGLYTGAEIAHRLGYGHDRAWVSDQRRAGKLLGVRRGGQYRYPGFQVNPDGQLREVMSDLIRLAREREWSDESLALWLASPSGSMPGDCRPAESLSDHPDVVVSAARAVMQPAW